MGQGMIDSPIVQADQYHMIRVEPIFVGGQWVNFLHGECLEWNKQIRQRFVDFFATCGTAFTLANNPKLLKFCTLLGGKIVVKTKIGAIVRFN